MSAIIVFAMARNVQAVYYPHKKFNKLNKTTCHCDIGKKNHLWKIQTKPANRKIRFFFLAAADVCSYTGAHSKTSGGFIVFAFLSDEQLSPWLICN